MRTIDKSATGYFHFYFENIFRFILNRLFPYFSMALVGILIANKNIGEFAFFSYIASAFIFPATIATFMFMAIGNLVSENQGREAGEIFISSLAMAVVSSALVGLTCLLIIISSSEEKSVLPLEYNASSVAFTYLIYIMIHVFNSFFNSFFEAHIKDRTSNIARLLSFVPLTCASMYAFMYTPATNFSMLAVFFMLASSSIEFLYYCYRAKRLNLWSSNCQPFIFKQLFVLGAPTGVGLALQRFAFFIVNKKLFLIDKDLVSIFSIAVSIVSLMTIPVAAFTQIHSIYVTRQRNIKLSSSVFGLLFISMLLPLGIFLCLGNNLLIFFGITHAMLSDNIYLVECVTLIFLVTSFLMLVSSHIRALGNTTIAQLVINVVVYGVYVGGVFYGGVDGRSASFLLATYSLSYFICFLLLAVYIYYIQKITTYETLPSL